MTPSRQPPERRFEGIVGKRLVIACAALGLLTAAVVVPVREADGAGKPTGLVGTLAAADCVRAKAEIGPRAFRKRYGPRRPTTRCMRATAPAARAAIAVATASCQAELDEWGLEDFLLEWESFAECVSLYADWEMDGGLEDDPDADMGGE